VLGDVNTHGGRCHDTCQKHRNQEFEYGESLACA
jgi:hypothetical protein